MHESEIRYRLTMHDHRGPKTLGPVILQTAWLPEAEMVIVTRMLSNTSADLPVALVIEKRMRETSYMKVSPSSFLK